MKDDYFNNLIEQLHYQKRSSRIKKVGTKLKTLLKVVIAIIFAWGVAGFIFISLG